MEKIIQIWDIFEFEVTMQHQSEGHLGGNCSGKNPEVWAEECKFVSKNSYGLHGVIYTLS